jgi:hypothetical protein
MRAVDASKNHWYIAGTEALGDMRLLRREAVCFEVLSAPEPLKKK